MQCYKAQGTYGAHLLIIIRQLQIFFVSPIFPTPGSLFVVNKQRSFPTWHPPKKNQIVENGNSWNVDFYIFHGRQHHSLYYLSNRCKYHRTNYSGKNWPLASLENSDRHLNVDGQLSLVLSVETGHYRMCQKWSGAFKTTLSPLGISKWLLACV